jgi:hypothetical protein
VTEHAEHENTQQEDSWLRHLENQKKLAAWEAQQKERKEQERRERKQEELARYLLRRGRDWVEITGEEPSPDEVRRWRREYLDQREAEHQARRRREIEELYP